MSEDVIVKAVLEGERPKVRELIADYQGCSPVDGSWDQLSTNDEIRYARWPGQTPDGKKNDAAYRAIGKSAFPWDGASDTRILMADEVINEQGSLNYVAFRRAMAAHKMSLNGDGGEYGLRLIEHWMNPLVMEDLIEQVRLSAQYRGHYGKFFLHPRWAREVQLERRKITLQEVTSLLQVISGEGPVAGVEGPESYTEGTEGGAQSPQSLALTGGLAVPGAEEFVRMLEQSAEDPELAKVCGEIVRMVHGLYAREEFAGEELDLPEVSAKSIAEAVKDLREEGEAWLPCPYVCRDELEILCLKPWEEVSVRGNVTELKRARVYRRVFLDEVSLKRKIVEEGWDPAWVKAALQHKGKVSKWGATEPTGVVLDVGKFEGRGHTMYQVPGGSEHGDVEVVYAYYWALDRDNVPGVFCTVFHPEVRGESDGAKTKGECAVHGLCEEGMIPFVLGRREVMSALLLESRGVPQVVNGWQREKKVFRDARIDLASIGVIPPINKYAGSVQGQYRFGPAVQNTVVRGNEPKFMDVPMNGSTNAKELTLEVDADKRRYFGLMGEDVPAPVSQARQQEDADSFLMAWMMAFQMGLKLAQKNMRDGDFARITGAPEGWLEENRQRRKLFGVVLEFDVREMDPEFVMKQIEILNKAVIPGDTSGVIDRTRLTTMLTHVISPRLAREVIQDAGAASQKLYDKVSADVGLMFLGNMPRLVENDPTAAMKLKFLEEIVGGNPVYQQTLAQGVTMGAATQGGGDSGTRGARPSVDGMGGMDGMGAPVNPSVRFAELMQLYRQNLEFSVTQDKNKQIGRIGVDPAQVGAGK